MQAKHHADINSVRHLLESIKAGPYAWPGGYPLFFWTIDGAPISFAEVESHARRYAEDIRNRSNDRIIGMEINWEDADLCCEVTGDRIESAYAEDDAAA